MIKFLAYDERKKRHFVGFGLSEENVKLLKEGRPIFVDGKTMQSNVDFFIFYGETEEKIADLMKDFIGPETIIHTGR